MKKYINRIFHGDVFDFLPKLKAESVSAVLTDPPYFLDKMDQHWKAEQVKGPKKPYAVKHLPAGMKFSKNQGKNFYSWYLQVSKELFRVLKPGGFFFSFSSPRLYHRMACAVDDAGFEIRDCFMWLYTQNQPKAMSLHHFIGKMDIPERQKAELHKRFEGWKTPQVKSCFEPITMAQKPLEGTYLQNTLRHNVSLINTQRRQGLNKDMFASNVMTDRLLNHKIDKVFLVDKPREQEKGAFNNHKTVKPLTLFKYLISLSTAKDALILDPFMGSGTTALACRELKRSWIGSEINKKYIDIALKRLKTQSKKEGALRKEETEGQTELSFV